MRQRFQAPCPFEVEAGKYHTLASGGHVGLFSGNSVKLAGDLPSVHTLAGGVSQMEDLMTWLRAEGELPADRMNATDVLAMLAELAAVARRTAEELNLIGRA